MADDFTLIRGKHQIAFGFDGRKDQFNSYNYQQANGQFTFNGTYTGDGLADLLTGQFSGLTDGNVISDYLRQTPIAAYVQDSFHATQHFSINYGLRWEPSVPSYDKYGRGNQFSWPLFLQSWHSSEYPTAPAGLIFSGDTAQDPNGKAFTKAHYATFSPRLGMVWDPKGDGKQTIRAGFVLMHDTTELFYPERWTTNAPYVSSLTINSNEFGVGTDLFSNPFNGYVLNGKPGDPFPGAAVFPLAGTYISVPPNLPVTYMMQWNLSYQRQIAANWMVQANYLGNAGRDIWGSTDVNYSIARRRRHRRQCQQPPSDESDQPDARTVLRGDPANRLGRRLRVPRSQSSRPSTSGLAITPRGSTTPGATAAALGISPANWRAWYIRTRSTAPRANAAIVATTTGRRSLSRWWLPARASAPASFMA